MLYGCAGGVFLQRFSVVSAELIKTKILFQPQMYIKGFVAIRTALGAFSMSQKSHQVFDIRIMMQHPWRSNGAMICGVYQCKRICQFAWVLIYCTLYICMFANSASILRPDSFCQRIFTAYFGIDKRKESLEFVEILQ